MINWPMLEVPISHIILIADLTLCSTVVTMPALCLVIKCYRLAHATLGSNYFPRMKVLQFRGNGHQ